ncbi:MAG: hypothetical protein WD767_03180 [Alphaproteobacteria bacterium]
MLETTVANSLPKPFWLAEPEKLWPVRRAGGDAPIEARKDAAPGAGAKIVRAEPG